MGKREGVGDIGVGFERILYAVDCLRSELEWD